MIHSNFMLERKLGKISLGRPHGRFFKNTFNNGIFSGNATSKAIFPVGVSVGMGKLARFAAFTPTGVLSLRN